ncbi:hypothetical protein AVEN_267972-1, partial [Araneus ventricosus]
MHRLLTRRYIKTRALSMGMAKPVGWVDCTK